MRDRNGNTLVELLTVIAICAVIVGLLVSAVQRVRESAARSQCENNQRQIALAMHNYHDVYRSFPYGVNNTIHANDNSRSDRKCWFFPVLPYVEQEALYADIGCYMSGTSPYALPAPYVVYYPKNKQILSLFICPSDSESPKTVTGGGSADWNQQGFHGNYVACAGSTNFDADGAHGINLTGLFYAFSKTRLHLIADGTSNTLMLSEIRLVPDGQDIYAHDTRGRYYNNAFQGSVLFSTQYPPNTLEVPDRLEWCETASYSPCSRSVSQQNLTARSYHNGVVNAAMADASVRTISGQITPSVYQALGTRDGREVGHDF